MLSHVLFTCTKVSDNAPKIQHFCMYGAKTDSFMSSDDKHGFETWQPYFEAETAATYNVVCQAHARNQKPSRIRRGLVSRYYRH